MNMLIAGLQKTTLVDYPGKVAATVFLRGCNFRCGFCHNPEIVLPDRFEGTIPEGEFFRFLESRLGKIQGVCITGGEPLLWRDTGKFISHIKALGFAVKLDTNGSYFDRLRDIIDEGDLDYVAMDIKSPIHKYETIINSKSKTGVIPSALLVEQASEESSNSVSGNNLIENITKSIDLIMSSGINYEFRTTVAKPLHHPDDFAHIGKMIKGAKKYFIQNFVQSKHVDTEMPFLPFSDQELKLAAANITPFVESVALR